MLTLALIAVPCLALQGPLHPTSVPELTLSFQSQPSSATAGAPIAPAIRVQVTDVFRAPFATTITLALESNPGGATLGGTLTKPTVNGVATFDDVTLDKAAAGYRLRASSRRFAPATSALFDVVAGAASRLAFTSSPAGTAAWAPLAPAPAVEVQDAFGNRVVTATNAVTIAFGANAGTNVLRATGTFDHTVERIDPVTPALLLPTPIQQASGVSALVVEPFTGVALGADTLNNFFLLDAASGAIAGIGAGTLPTTTKGMAFDHFGSGLLLGVQNASGNVSTIDLFTGNATFVGSISVPGTVVLGVQGLAMDPTDGVIYAVSALGTSPPTSRALVTLDPITLNATVIGELGDKVAAIAFRPDGSLYALTGAGSTAVKVLFSVNKSTAAMTPVLALGGGDISEAMTIVPAQLLGTKTAIAAAGVAAFPGLRVDAPAAGYSLTATSPGLASATSAPFGVGAPSLAGTVAFTSTAQSVQETGGLVTVGLTMTPAQAHDVIAWVFVGGTASGAGSMIPDHDLVASAHLPIVFPSGQTSATLSFHVLNDGIANPGSKSVILTIKRAALGTIGAPSVHTVTIVKI